MEETKESLLAYSSIYGKALDEIRQIERETTIMTIRRKMEFSAEQIANMTSFSIEYIQSVIDKFEKGG